MEVYFVRHGETGGNIARRHQAEHTPLTPEGRAQIEAVIPKLSYYKPTHLIASSHLRAVESARSIGLALQIVPDISLLFVELQRPAHLYGHFHRSLRSLWFYLCWYCGLVGGDGSDAHGESYRALRLRLVQAREHLEGYGDDARVIVVSHAVFMQFFVAHLTNARPLSPWRAALVFMRVLTMPNADVIHCRYTHGASSTWQVVSDHVG